MGTEGNELPMDDGATKLDYAVIVGDNAERASECGDNLTNQLGEQMTYPLDVVVVECEHPNMAVKVDNAMWDDNIDDKFPDSKPEVLDVVGLARIQ